MPKILILIIFFFLTKFSLAQFLNTNVDSTWYKYKKEIIIGGGATQFLGDLGGRNYDRPKRLFNDIDIEATSWQAHLGFRYHYHPLFATTSLLHLGQYNASDYYTFGNRRSAREINIKGGLIDFSQRIEFIFYSKYSAKYINDKPRYKRFELYTFTGIGVCYFEPRSSKYEQFSMWKEGVRLRQLSTEGQGQPGGFGETYKPFTIVIPFGFGLQKSISRRRSIKFELTYIKSFTDYMDDTSTKYYSYPFNDVTASPEQLVFSNPAGSAQFKNGDERGGKGKDCYFYASFSFVKALGIKDKKSKTERSFLKNLRLIF